MENLSEVFVTGDGSSSYGGRRLAQNVITGKWFRYNVASGEWEPVYDSAVDLIAEHSALPDTHHPQVHSHPTHGDIDFTGGIKVGGVGGITGSKTITGFGTLTFVNGILTGFTPA